MTRSNPLIVAIDGPSGVGKTTVAAVLAKRLRLPMLDTGAMYRSVALEALEQSLDITDRKAVRRLLKDLDLALRSNGEGGSDVLIAGEPVGAKIRTPEVTHASSVISTHSAVRKRMVEIQQAFGRRSGAVLEGRDIGTVVFPDTPYKFFLTAQPVVRAERRLRDLKAAGRGGTLEEVQAELEERDERDRTRNDSPLTQTDEHFEIDASDLRPPEIVERMIGVIRRQQAEEAEAAEAAEAGDPTASGPATDDASDSKPAAKPPSKPASRPGSQPEASASDDAVAE